jgi:hypothetical protein
MRSERNPLGSGESKKPDESFDRQTGDNKSGESSGDIEKTRREMTRNTGGYQKLGEGSRHQIQADHSRDADITRRLQQLSNRHAEINPDRDYSARQKIKGSFNAEYRPKMSRVKAINQQIQANGGEIAELNDISMKDLNTINTLINQAQRQTELASTYTDDQERKIPSKEREDAVKKLEKIGHDIRLWKEYLVDQKGQSPREIWAKNILAEGTKVLNRVNEMEGKKDRDTRDAYRQRYKQPHVDMLMAKNNLLERYRDNGDNKNSSSYEVQSFAKGKISTERQYQTFINTTDGIVVIGSAYKEADKKLGPKNSQPLDHSEILWNELEEVAALQREKKGEINLTKITYDVVTEEAAQEAAKYCGLLDKVYTKPEIFTFAKGTEEYTAFAGTLCKAGLYLVAEHQGKLGPTEVPEIQVEMDRGFTIRSIRLPIRPK